MIRRRPGGAVIIAAIIAILGLTGATPAAAVTPVEVVHTERIDVGPYPLTIGFSQWPLRAMQSLDFTFRPAGGIEDKRATLQRIAPGSDGPGGVVPRLQPLPRHPRKLDVWGLDVKALNTEGDWTFRFEIDGPLGHGSGALTGLRVLPQPGPPLSVSWSITTLPLIVLLAATVFAWRRVRPDRRPETWQYS